jgi:predicted RNA methylase
MLVDFGTSAEQERFTRSAYSRRVPGDGSESQSLTYDRWFLLGERRNEVLDLWEVERYGRDSFGDPDFVSIYGLKPADWYDRGVRLLGRTAVECTRDLFADLLARDVASVAKVMAPGAGSIVVDPFVGSGNTLYWLTRHVQPARSVGFEQDDAVFDLTRRNLAIMSLGIDVLHESCEQGLKRLAVPDGESIIVFVSPPWGEALDLEAGLDLGRTTPPVAAIIDLATSVFRPHNLLFAVQAYESVEAESLAEVTARFDSSALTVYDINPHAKNPGLILGTVGWSAASLGRGDRGLAGLS